MTYEIKLNAWFFEITLFLTRSEAYFDPRLSGQVRTATIFGTHAYVSNAGDDHQSMSDNH
jgi:hypothetical protein